ncbi:carbamoyl-phosphate synthase small subunit [Arcanobacterium pluranimalium]|uniref:glutamine-hydrolyzing carbamoyl-phosphate synthase small subunit n=1 Tax=Arcanobacterium pluranimalium TaxID=108028 RepID=UPI001959CE80|nr:glutamine-hydrolyzing carbamoyl-phosphate synthase small subunit [Arcanobacterium pluranimalium]MBM7825480.1 carbamoyl-phosphate synthase small subunit [Arcanobacterium pluranimalium]
MTTRALLVLADGTSFQGYSVGAAGTAVGEVVFNTSMTGYQEILTDPSYYQQLVTLTYPHIGNTGTNSQDIESSQIFASGLIVRDVPFFVSNYRAENDLPSYLSEHGTVAIAGIDTRRLTRVLREKGSQAGAILTGDDAAVEYGQKLAQAFGTMTGKDLAREVTCGHLRIHREGTWNPNGKFDEPNALPWRVVAYDFGMKTNIARMLADRGCEVYIVPATTPASEVLALKPHGVFLSNGPGDPEPCTYAVEAIREILKERIPIFGICLGHQLLALALGAATQKMVFGHHGANHPVKDLRSDRVFITSQNHGFCVDPASLPSNAEVTHISLFDDSLQGLEMDDQPAFSFQGHPEASPGPHDLGFLFDHFIELIHDDIRRTREVYEQSNS